MLKLMAFFNTQGKIESLHTSADIIVGNKIYLTKAGLNPNTPLPLSSFFEQIGMSARSCE